MTNIGSFTIPGLKLPDDTPHEPVVVEPVVVEPTPVDPPEPAAEPVMVDPIEPVAPPDPVVVPEPTFEEIFEQRFGKKIPEVESVFKEVESLKQRPFVEDPELVADDDFLKDFIRNYKRNGNVAEYLEVRATDFSKMTAEEVVKYVIRKSKPNAPESVINREYRERLRSLGHSDDLEAGTSEHKDYLEAVEWQASELREKLAEQSKKFAIPQRTAPPAQDTANLEEQAREYLSTVLSSAPVTEMMAAKTLKYGDFAYSIDPQKVVSMLSNDQELFKHFLNPDGTQDTAKYLKWIALAPDPVSAINAAVSAAVAKERIKWLAEIKNPSTPDNPAPPPVNGKISVRLVPQSN